MNTASDQPRRSTTKIFGANSKEGSTRCEPKDREYSIDTGHECLRMKKVKTVDGVRSNFKRRLVHNTGAGGGLSGKVPTKIYDFLTRKI